ncbi:DinB family protein [Nocardia sp. NBC_00508]|uniref:DinB family protein n=1 Tax=Nocardia sp. NBC_00508 TaxID=2975992 RepID=UPI002E804492|nr:DinB family protein [Nocardia sp. NBC_00508]WUD67456.1 DinB family protein [Nocardia sp. NBC_00508]
MRTPRRDLLRWQFDLTWSLAGIHLDALTAADFLWEPAGVTWTVRPDADGIWRPDWADTEPDPAPVPTIGWLTWHIGWWWGSAINHAERLTPPARENVHWPGDGPAAIACVRDLGTEWERVLDGLTEPDLDRPTAYPWPADAGLTLAHMAGWVNAELMKNVAEIGHLRMLRAASLA